MRMDDETFVVSSARRGDERAWRGLFEAHVDAVYQFCLGLPLGRPDRAEEITQLQPGGVCVLAISPGTASPRAGAVAPGTWFLITQEIIITEGSSSRDGNTVAFRQ